MTTDTRTSAQGPDAARALQTQQQGALATQAEAPPAGAIIVRGISGREDQMLERVEAVIKLPAAYQYAIPIKGVKNDDGSWNNEAAKVGITSDGYDYLNRVIGCTFFFPPEVHDEKGEMHPNPIHRSDYIYMRVGGVWRNPIGQLVAAVEDVEVDFGLMYQNKRANLASEIVMGENGPVWDAAGNAVLKLTPANELKAYKELTQNRSFGPRYAITVGRIRILKMATGMRSMPVPQIVDGYPLKVVGFRDMMTPQERVAEATGTLETLYGGRPADIKPLTAEEAAEAGLETDLDADERAEQAAVEAAITNRAPEPGDPEPAVEPTVEPVGSWDATLAELDAEMDAKKGG